MRRAAIVPLLLLAACSATPANNQAAAGSQASPAANAPAAAPGTEVMQDSAALADSLPPEGRHTARIMELAPPPEAVALRDRMAAAILRNRAWFESWAAQHPQGALPWHANLGISEADYRRYLALTRQIGLRERARATLTVRRRPDGGLALEAAGAATPLDGIVIYPRRGRAETPLGPLGVQAATGNGAADSPLGRWLGIEWSNRGAHARRALALSAGKRAAGDRLLYYNYGPSDEETLILLYPATAPAR